MRHYFYNLRSKIRVYLCPSVVKSLPFRIIHQQSTLNNQLPIAVATNYVFFQTHGKIAECLSKGHIRATPLAFWSAAAATPLFSESGA
jgi:hypothetical protein